MNTGETIKKIRQELGISRQELADKLKVSPQMIYKWETGRSNPKMHTITRIADALEVSLFELISPYDAENEYCKVLKILDGKVLGNDSDESSELATYDDQKQLLSNFDSVTDEGKVKIIDYSEDIASNPKYKKDPEG